MRKRIVAGNWKMNNNAQQTQELIQGLKTQQPYKEGVEVIIAPTFVNLQAAVQATADTSIGVAAQNMHQAVSGAYTGEISADMLKSIGIDTVILGHSERRSYFGETDQLLAEKVAKALDEGLRIIFCFGEELADREAGNHFSLVSQQLTEGLKGVTEAQLRQIVLAYEPVWAIGTGVTASPEQAQEMHEHIRKHFTEYYSEAAAQAIIILYGGSVKPANAAEIFGKPDVDGGLIGGASLKAEDFAAIINA